MSSPAFAALSRLEFHLAENPPLFRGLSGCVSVPRRILPDDVLGRKTSGDAPGGALLVVWTEAIGLTKGTSLREEEELVAIGLTKGVLLLGVR